MPTIDLVHIDVARNATDDFNLFHDKKRWQEIEGNPFGGPIALGFQLECFIEHQCRLFRQRQKEEGLIEKQGLVYSNYQLSFANVVKPGDDLSLTIKASKHSDNAGGQLSNRLMLKTQRGLVLMGFKTESATAQFQQPNLAISGPLEKLEDRSFIDDDLFYKRKFTTNSNAKNFLTGSLVEQSDYFDEINDKCRFPETYCSSLISCALLERLAAKGHDFRREPMVYTQHKLSLHRPRIATLRSDQALHFVVSPPRPVDGDANGMLSHQCFCFDCNNQLLLQGEIALAPLAVVLAKG